MELYRWYALPHPIYSHYVVSLCLCLVVGQVEQEGRSVNVRIRDDVSTRRQGVPVALEEFISKLTELRDSRSLSHGLGGETPSSS
jgi:threonyl-tRNA synthetase